MPRAFTSAVFRRFSKTRSAPILHVMFDAVSPITPNANDTIQIDAPVGGQKRVGGMSGGIAFEAMTFFDVGALTLDTASIDGAAGNDVINIGGAGMVASRL